MAYTYKHKGKTISLQIDDSVVAVRFKEPAPATVRAEHAARAGLGPFARRIELPGEKFTLFPVGSPAAGPASAAVFALAATPSVVRATPVFKRGDRRFVATDRIVVGFDAKVEDADARRFLARRNYEVIDAFEGAYVVRLPETDDPFREIEKLEAATQVRFAEPDFVIVGRNVQRPSGGAAVNPSATAADPLQNRQYCLKVTRAADAWTLFGEFKPSIRIAILDEGVDRAHEDLSVLAEYDATGDDLDQQPNDWDGHGTACAGLAAAKAGNGVGIRGVASGFPLIAVRIALSPAPGADWSTSNAIIARGIDWAWSHGADVLSNSWGDGPESTLIEEAFQRALKKGRGGQGCVVVIAAGNANAPIRFPATIADLIVVTASNERDEPKTPTSSDGEDWWGSSYGPESWVAAPGVHNYTTDITGAAGYSDGGKDDQGRPFGPNYAPAFNGTSSATPIVAGAAALVLQANPTLGPAAVRRILRESAAKVGAQYDASGHDDRMGYGRIDVYEAVRRALPAAGVASVSDNGPAPRRERTAHA